MPTLEAEFAPLRDPRFAARFAQYATSPFPVWLWSADGSRLLWTNAVGAAVFGASDTNAATQRRFDPKEPAAAVIVRLAATLPAADQSRLERLRGFGAGFGRALTCTCTRVVTECGAAVLIAAAEAAGPALTHAERLHRLFADDGRALAAFAPEGALLYGTSAALARFDGAATLSALRLDAIAKQALAAGTAEATTPYGTAAARRLGTGASTAILLAFASPPGAADPQEDRTAAPPSMAPEAREPSPEAAASPSPTAPPSSPRHVRHDEAAAARRHPLRFVWQMDADGRFVIGSDEFIELMGPHTTAAFGRTWREIAAELKLDPEDQVARAVATQETWSGIVALWPVDGSNERLPVELSGLPVFGRDRAFRGYRGFGVCREIGLINQLARVRRDGSIGLAAEPGAVRQGGARSQSDAPDDRQSTALPAPMAVVTEADPASSPANTDGVGDLPAAKPSASETSTDNVLPFRSGGANEPNSPSLSPVERRAFGELAQELTARLRATRGSPVASAAAPGAADEQITGAESIEATCATSGSANHQTPGGEDEPLSDFAGAPPPPPSAFEPVLLDRIPVGVLVHRENSVLYANRQLLDWIGYESTAAFAAADGLSTLFAANGAQALSKSDDVRPLAIVTRAGASLPVDARLFTVPWNGSSAVALVLTDDGSQRPQRAVAVKNELHEIRAVLDAAADGAIMIDRAGAITALTGGAERVFGRAANELEGCSLGALLAPESDRIVRERLDLVARGEPLHGGPIDVKARVRGGELASLSMTLTRIADEGLCAIFHDTAPLKKIEEELRAAKRQVQRMAAAKTEFLGKVSHEIRTPLNAITGFAEVIMAERFGPVGNERYREYLKDIHAAGTHLASLLNDLLDLSRVETGQLDLTFANVSLNELTQQCVGIMQPHASRARIIIRTSLTSGHPKVIADERSLRQIVLNLLSNSIRFTGPGGQVIVSTAFADSGEAVLRVRDTGIGMSEKDVEAALEPFRQTATSANWGSGGTGLGLPLTKALAEANRAYFNIKSAPNAGTLIEVAFPSARVVAR